VGLVMRLALAGDTMLGRGVAQSLARASPTSLVTPELAELMRAADLTMLNLECCVSERGSPIRLPGKPFFFRAPPRAVELLAYLGVDCVTLANNHALDFGEIALLDTFGHLEAAGIAWVGAGPNLARARSPVRLHAADANVVAIAFTDHPSAFAAQRDRPGVAYVDLEHGLADWVIEAISEYDDDCVLVTPHWGPNMAGVPQPYVRSAAAALLNAGASLVAGHSAHVVQGTEGRILYDLGDFLDDYRVDPVLRNDLGLLFLIDVDRGQPRRIEAVPLKLDYCRTGLATGEDALWIRRRFRDACEVLGGDVSEADGQLVLNW
jgi:poly-gamma-glutamate capsule biosynthesis protein CapA/YwtB (metallophosphatase superfamily)